MRLNSVNRELVDADSLPGIRGARPSREKAGNGASVGTKTTCFRAIRISPSFLERLQNVAPFLTVIRISHTPGR
jgi:hypothetical protein